MKESDLYLPVKQLLESQGYEVKGEVGDCDVLAVRGSEDTVVVELKLSFNIRVLLQAVERLALTPTVYIGIAEQCSVLKRNRAAIKKLLKMLGIGLLIIEPKTAIGSVDVMLDPAPYTPRQTQKSKREKEWLLAEFIQLVGDPNVGGSKKRKMTSYRQRALAIAAYLQENGATKASVMAAALGIAKARHILYRNVYGWFVRQSQGIYDLSPKGKVEIIDWEKQIKVQSNIQ